MTDEPFREPTADRPPTAAEERAAEEAVEDVDVERAATHYREMTDLGAHVQGEGQIEPTTGDAGDGATET